MEAAYINHIDYYIPNGSLLLENHITSSSIKDFFNNSEEFLTHTRDTLELDEVRVELQFSSLEEMMMNLLKENISSKKVIPEKIQYIIVAVDYSDQLVNFGHKIQYELGMSQANVIRITDNYCANIDVAIGMASHLLKGLTNEQHILILSGSKLEPNLDNRIVGTYGILGDSASLMVMGSQENEAVLEVLDQFTFTKGELYEMNLVTDNTVLHFQSYLESLNGLIKPNFLSSENIDQIILHNSNHKLIEQVLKYSKLDLNTIYKENQGKYGHLGTTDLLLNLETYLKKNRQSDLQIVSLNLGVLGTYSATLFIT